MSFTTLLSQGSGCALAFLLAGSMSLWGTPKINEIALRFNLLDKPSARKVHQRPIARLGGVAIAFASILSIAFTNLLGFSTLAWHLPLADSQTQAILLGGFSYFCIGFADDLFDLSAKKRLAIQFCIAFCVWMAGIRIDCSSFSPITHLDLTLLSLPITLLWIVGVVNAVNWIDGLDGLAAGTSGISCIPLIVISILSSQLSIALFSAALLGALLGFLVFNFNPAKIFMGDGGSYFIGFLLASMSISCFLNENPIFGILPCILALAIPLVDMTLVVACRLLDGKSPFIADQRHLHHRLLKLGLSHKNVVLLIYSACTCMSMLSIFSLLVIDSYYWLLKLSCLSIALIGTFWIAVVVLGRLLDSDWKTPYLTTKPGVKSCVEHSSSNPQSPISI